MQYVDLTLFKRVLSGERLEKYIAHASRYQSCHPIEIYTWNAALSESLYPTLEVALRNAIHRAMVDHFKTEDWLIIPDFLCSTEQQVVKQAIQKLKKRKKEPTIGRIIAELKFGFWTTLFDKRYEQILWIPIIKDVFPKLERRKRTRKNLSRLFNKIRNLRNRVFHYEPIWHWQDLKEQYQAILLAIHWIEPKALVLCEFDRFLTVYHKGPKSLEVSR